MTDIPSVLHYSLFAIFKTSERIADTAGLATELEAELDKLGVKVRGYYDVAGYRPDADLMMWVTGKTGDEVQNAYRAVLSSRLGAFLEPVWSVISMLRESEFNKAHLPGFLGRPDPEAYLSIYPFVRSYDWYYMDPEKRSQILRDHGAAGKGFGDIISSTLATFSLSDYEWLVALEATTPERLVDVMRAFRNTEARLYVREDTPFFTGKRMSLADWVELQPKA